MMTKEKFLKRQAQKTNHRRERMAREINRRAAAKAEQEQLKARRAEIAALGPVQIVGDKSAGSFGSDDALVAAMTVAQALAYRKRRKA